MAIKADLFRITVRSILSATQGNSITLSLPADKIASDGEYRLSYLNRQETPEPASTDEGSHDRAATLQIDVAEPLLMRGVYWTRRKWREGMNTAGMIEVTRVSQRHAPKGIDLLAHARQLAQEGQISVVEG